jgi:hypothetical protein
MRYFITVFSTLITLSSLAFGQFSPRSFGVQSEWRALDDDAPSEPEGRLGSNVIIDILPGENPDVLWLGTGNGVSKLLLNLNASSETERYRFSTYSDEQGLGKGGISGLFVTDSIVWAAFAFDTTVGISGAGGGLAYTRDNGANWTWFPQPRDRLYGLNRQTGEDTVLGYWPTATNVDNITYAFAMTENNVWIASKGGGLRKHHFAVAYTDYNDTTGWRVVSPDGTPFNTGAELADRTFSLAFDGTYLWVGTANGMYRTDDEGLTWQHFSAAIPGISGNFVTALDFNSATNSLWAATWRATGQNEFYAVSKTSNLGASWQTTLTEDQIEAAIGRRETPRIHGFAFSGNTTWACDDIGLWKSLDAGLSWDLYSQIRDSVRAGHAIYEDAIYSALRTTAPDLMWVGGLDGLALSYGDRGLWHTLQTAAPLDDAARSVDTYAYPNPYSPNISSVVRFLVNSSGGSATLTVYDFAMSEVVELPSQIVSAGDDYLTWDGKKSGVVVANGTYFYKIEKPGGEVWGKLIVLD